MPELPQGGYYFCFTPVLFLYAYWMNRIRFMTSLHRLLNSMTTLLHSLSNIFIQYLLTIHNNDLVVACRRVWGVLSRVKCTLRALDRTPHTRLFIIIRAMARPAHSTHAIIFYACETVFLCQWQSRYPAGLLPVRRVFHCHLSFLFS